MNMSKISNVFWFIVAVAVGSVSLQQLDAMANEAAVQVKKEVVLGHRIGANGQEIIVTK